MVFLLEIRLKMDQIGLNIDQKGLKIHTGLKLFFFYQQYLFLAKSFTLELDLEGRRHGTARGAARTSRGAKFWNHTLVIGYCFFNASF